MPSPEERPGPPDPDVDTMPDLRTVTEDYDRVLEAAADLLDGPISVDINVWEDGEYRIHAYHGYGPTEPGGPRLKSIIRCHSAEPGLTAGLVEVQPDGGETLIFEEKIRS